jgi:uncharacterized protein (TIGR02246 family)
VQSDEQAIRQLVADWLSASKAGDNQKILELMADDVVFLIRGQPHMRGRPAFAAAQAGLRDFDMEGTSEIQEIKFAGDWAYMRTKLMIVTTSRNGRAPMKRAGTTLSILQKRDGKWVLFRDANLLAPAPG